MRGTMDEVRLPGVTGEAPRICPRCGGQATVHAKVQRAIYDWEVTFVECLRLRCCGATFTSAPSGLTPRSRYSDRVIRLTQALVTSGVSMRACAKLLVASGVPVTSQSIRAWCASVEQETTARARVVEAPLGDISIPLREGRWLAIDTGRVAQVMRILERFTAA